MSDVFPGSVRKLPKADIPVPGLQAYLSQASDHQILFMEFQDDAEIPAHAHAAQWTVVLEGRMDLEIEGVARTCRKGDRIFIPTGEMHSARIHAGYADITFVDQKDRYKAKWTVATSALV